MHNLNLLLWKKWDLKGIKIWRLLYIRIFFIITLRFLLIFYFYFKSWRTSAIFHSVIGLPLCESWFSCLSWAFTFLTFIIIFLLIIKEHQRASWSINASIVSWSFLSFIVLAIYHFLLNVLNFRHFSNNIWSKLVRFNHEMEVKNPRLVLTHYRSYHQSVGIQFVD